VKILSAGTHADYHSLMLRVVAIACVAWLATGCLLDRSLGTRPARFHVGPNTRSLVVPITQSPGAPPSTTFSSTSPAPEKFDTRLAAVTAVFQFTMSMRGLYLGGEAETGQLEARGSNFAGAYGIAGIEHSGGLGSLGVELASGWRGLRFDLGDDDHDSFVVEPRVRGQLWIGDQFTLGAAAGAVLGERGDWMAGVYLGIHSHDRKF
jgi:hypothetical protein